LGFFFSPSKGRIPTVFDPDGRKLTAMKIYVGNLAYRTTDDDLRQEFEKYGSVGQVDIITDRETGRSKGFGFVEMLDNDQANAAIQALDGQTVGDRTLKVNEARPKAPRPSGGGGFGGGGGGRSRGDRERRY
jgi:RNA recognition motif-containing protein